MPTIPSDARIRTSGARRQDTSLEEVLNEISGLIGMENIKENLDRLIALARVYLLRRERDIPTEKIALHMVFLGPPGTGKTVVARKIGKLFKAIGLLRSGHLVEVDRSKLVGLYQGETAKLVTECVKSAENGVLFIDEAYSLAGGTGPLSTSDQFGNEAIQTLLKLMEDKRDNLVVIVAGYKDAMRRFLENNAGLRSRFALEWEFESYSHDELIEIFQVMINEGRYTLAPGAAREAERHIRTWDRNDERFGNARQVRSYFEALLPVQAMRLAETVPDLEALTNEELLTLTADDMRIAAR